MKFFTLLFMLFFLFPAFIANAQEEEEEQQELEQQELTPVPAEPPAEVPFYIELDIRTSTLQELAAWARDLGLSDGGTREQLASRLRAFYGITAGGAAPVQQRIITIESAKTTEYFTVEVIEEEYARLTGDVIISLRDGNALHRVMAHEILYNRTRNVLTATGDVEYIREEGNSTETFRGQTITVNLEDWSSIFMDGVSERAVSGNASTYRFAGTIISRNPEGATVLTGAEITNPASEEVFWSLTASRLWLLPGNDWAILNAVLWVGNIPLLYVPAFYYPADQLIFHPVMGYRSRDGTYLQTTTYVLGPPRATVVSESSLSTIFGGGADGGSLVREGIFLRTTGERRVDHSSINMTLLADAYVNLGFYLGTDLTLPAWRAFGSTTVSAGLGLTRDIFQAGGAFTPFPNHDGESRWNSTNIFSVDFPFRYRLNAKGSIIIPNGTLNWELPFYSDPYTDRDFLRRAEAQDWLGMLRDWNAPDPIDTTLISSFDWRISGSYNPRFPDLAPYINSISISNFSSNLLFNERVSRQYQGPTAPPNPGRAFFFPNRFTLFSASGAIAGAPFTFGGAPTATPAPEGPAPGDTLLPDLPIPPWEVPEDDSVRAAIRSEQDIFILSPPVLAQTFTLPSIGGPRLSIDYRLSPTAASELQFRSTADNWTEPQDINWGEVSTVLSRFRGDGSIGFNLAHTGGGAYSGALRLSGTGSWQDFSYLNENAEEFSTGGRTDPARISTARNRAYNETFFTSSWDFTGTVRPLFGNPVWSNSNFQYSLRGLLARTNVDVTGADPEWDWVFGKWDSTDISAHQISANAAANIRDNNQTLSISAVIPPRDPSVSANATIRAGISETSLRGRVQLPTEEVERVIEPIHFNETLRFTTRSNFRQNIVYDPELGEFTSFTSNLTYEGLTASYTANYSLPWRYNLMGNISPGAPDGWVQLPDRSFNPQEFRVAYNRTITENNFWDGRMSLSFNFTSSLALDLQRYTNSRLATSIRMNLGITNFLTFSLSTNSENVVMFKYLQGLPFFNLPTRLYPGQESNIFVDLLNSFRFDNDDLRRRSGFKMKGLDLSLIHHLGDWNARLTMNLAPHLPAGSTNYRFSSDITFLVQWVPISELSTQIDYIGESLWIR
ncbi:MAG: LPS-assembly protein LptD [Treponema sp.]|nr:LPS-assembly protein LptD [Treponema sp.]